MGAFVCFGWLKMDEPAAGIYMYVWVNHAALAVGVF